jgi:multiple sugar transport system permease protein
MADIATGYPLLANLPNPSNRPMPLTVLRRRQIAALGWTWLIMLILGTVFLGTFLIAFLASLKSDPLESPFRFIFPQIMPSAWVAAADLGSQGGSGPWWGGFTPKADIAFSVTYAAPKGTVIADPKVEVPRRVPGSGVAAAITKEFASDYAKIELSKAETFAVADPATGEAGTWTATRFDYRITYEAEAGVATPNVMRIPFTAEAARGLVLIDSSLPVTQMERRGRLASWNNIAPGALGLVFDNYRRLMNETVEISSGDRMFGNWLWTSFIISFGRVLIIVAFSTLAGYALARMQFSGARLVFALVILSLAIPQQVTFISNYLVMRDLNMLNTPWAVILVYHVSFPAQVLLMKQFFEGFPREIEEAAIMDGASRLQTLWKVVVPNSKPALMTNAIMTFQAAWNDFFWPFILLTSPPKALTVQVGLLGIREQSGQGEGDWGLVLAGAFISIIPVVLMFILFQRYIIDNQLNEGIK